MNARIHFAETVVRLIEEYNTRDDVSIYSLVMGSGYPTHRDAINVFEIERTLRAQPELVDQWIQYSEDKRCSDTWIIFQGLLGYWIVAHVQKGGRIFRKARFLRKIRACAHFIMHELDSIASH